MMQAMVCGLGASGTAAARLLRAEGAQVLGVDERDTPETRTRAEELRALGCTVQLGADPVPEGAFDVAVVSPGLRSDGPFLTEVRRRGIPLVSELELGWSRFRGKTVAVTGSHGKSSVVKVLAEALGAGAGRAVACGNYGLPVCQAVMEKPGADWLVIEASSFQLETCVAFRPQIGVLLNVLPNHLDRHGTLEAYARLKARLFARQGDGDTAVVPPEWLARMRAWSGGKGKWKTFGTGPDVDMACSAGQIAGRDGWRVELNGSLFDNEVLGPNAAAAALAGRSAGLTAEQMSTALRRFEPLPHRAQLVAETGGVRYVDDSKATSLSALAASVRMQGRPVWLIAGGRPKETDFGIVREVLAERVKGIFLIGESAAAMARAWGDAAACRDCGTLDRAVAEARRCACAGDTVLLAPGCTSYDQYRSYNERGEHFAGLVREKG